MKHIKLFESFDKNIIYEFSFRENIYQIEFKKIDDTWELLYYIWDGESWSVSKTNQGNIYQILDIIFGKYLNKFIREWGPKEIIIEGLPKEREKEYVSQRTKAYLRYLKRNIPIGWEIYPKGDPKNNIIKLKYIENETTG